MARKSKSAPALEHLDHLDMVIVGAGLSGIGAAHHFQDAFPRRSYAVLEAREASGGTWDLFRYPGIRSDSDMFTLGFRFRPWTGENAIADGPSILSYLRTVAAESGIDKHIRYGHRLLRADWSTADSRWTLTVELVDTGETTQLTCDFFMACSGYYRYDEGFTPDFPGIEEYKGQVVHPQHWPADLDYKGKKVVVIGSGATAVTLVPSMAPDAGHITMLQRSPTYIIPAPQRDMVAKQMRKVMPRQAAYELTRARWIATTVGLYQFCRTQPSLARKMIRKSQERLLPEDFDYTHLTPKYDPWDQRLCVVPSGDLFKAISKHKVDLVTDTIDTFTEKGIRVASGQELEADIVITATGLNLLAFGGAQLAIDAVDVHLPDTMAYKGMMLSGIPNFVYVIGYTNASWTLKAEMVFEYTMRMLEHMERNHLDIAVPKKDPTMPEEPFLDFAAGYVLRSVDKFPKQGAKAPWKLRMNYYRDVLMLRRGPVVDEAMEYRAAHARASADDLSRHSA